MRLRGRRLLAVVLAGLVGWAVGYVAAVPGHVLPISRHYPFLAESLPFPHHVPKYPGGLSFRFAMAHDVLVERFPKHGPAYYTERNRRTRQAFDGLAADDPGRFPLLDDLAVGLERLGKSDEAAALMREKLERQAAAGLQGRDLYTTYANLGTFLIHASFAAARGGDAEAKARFREGSDFVRKSVEVNPEAHFGREAWQAAVAEFLLAAMERPEWLSKFDCLGNRLDLPIDWLIDRENHWVDTGYGSAVDPDMSQEKVDREIPAFFGDDVRPDDPNAWASLSPIRAHITKVGAEEGWDAVGVTANPKPVPFDEPMLGLIGMWRQGGGANPHFALAIGETMLRVGQRYIAWEAFERARDMADRFWPDPEVVRKFREHCDARQAQIEGTIPEPPADLRARFQSELAFGRKYQEELQAYEAEAIAAGASIDDPHFLDAFDDSHVPIASRTGPEEQWSRVPHDRIYAYQSNRRYAFATFGAGAAAFVAALFALQLDRRRSPHLGVSLG